ncbi:General secretion pathway protein I [Methylocella tundrae]|uniref:General secretion pathway protein I n=1 Tax=Methylocella tundrae TaxID=227605 RepID=A0A8B6MAW0_METTU|nr:type II secretion system protein [Methylocella tundrae]VTZ51409.1 General secretion pathway protein I [Methylocella tundrae]
MCKRRPSEARASAGAEAGFTLIEVLIALAVVAVCISAIGALMGTNIRAVHQIDQRLVAVSTLRKVETALPERSKLVAADLAGDASGGTWSVSASPFIDPSPPIAGKEPPSWVPEAIAIKVRSPSGSLVEVETLRLVPRTDK